jgi:hypothetical protein
MESAKKTFSDPLIDEIRATRQRLVRQYGGLEGWVRHLQEEQKKHPEKIRAAPQWVPPSPSNIYEQKDRF